MVEDCKYIVYQVYRRRPPPAAGNGWTCLEGQNLRGGGGGGAWLLGKQGEEVLWVKGQMGHVMSSPPGHATTYGWTFGDAYLYIGRYLF